MIRKLTSALTAVGLIFILVGGLRSGDATSGAFAFVGFLILGVVTYPPADARRGAQAAMVLGSALSLLALGLLLEELREGAVKVHVLDDLLVLAGSGMVVLDAAGRWLGKHVADRMTARWGEERHRGHPVSPIL